MKVYRVVVGGRFEDGFFSNRMNFSSEPAKTHNDFFFDLQDRYKLDPDKLVPTPDKDTTKGMRLRDFWMSLSGRETSLAGEPLRKDYRFGFTSKKQLRAAFRSKKVRDFCDANDVLILVLEVPKKHVVSSAHQCLFRADVAEMGDPLNFSELLVS